MLECASKSWSIRYRRTTDCDLDPLIPTNLRCHPIQSHYRRQVRLPSQSSPPISGIVFLRTLPQHRLSRFPAASRDSPLSAFLPELIIWHSGLIVQQLSEKVFKFVVRMPHFTHWLSFARRSKCDKVPNDLMKFFSHLSRAGKAYF